MKQLELITRYSCVHDVHNDCNKGICPYLNKGECESYKPIGNTGERYSHLNLYRTRK